MACMLNIAMVHLCDSYPRFLWAVFLYAQLWVEDICRYYYASLVLFLPACMFGPPFIRVVQSFRPSLACDSCDSSDADSECDERDEVELGVFVSKLEFLFDDGHRAWTRDMHVRQLLPFMRRDGRFMLSDIEAHYASLVMILLHYTKYRMDTEQLVQIEREIDVRAKKDARNNQSCRLGVAL